MTQGPAMTTRGSRPRTTPSATGTARTIGREGAVTALIIFGAKPPGPDPWAWPRNLRSVATLADRRDVVTLHSHLTPICGLDESGEERVRAQRLGLELRVELDREEPG